MPGFLPWENNGFSWDNPSSPNKAILKVSLKKKPEIFRFHKLSRKWRKSIRSLVDLKWITTWLLPRAHSKLSSLWDWGTITQQCAPHLIRELVTSEKQNVLWSQSKEKWHHFGAVNMHRAWCLSHVVSSVTLGTREVKCTELSKLEGEASEGEKDWRHQLEIDNVRHFEVYEKKCSREDKKRQSDVFWSCSVFYYIS